MNRLLSVALCCTALSLGAPRAWAQPYTLEALRQLALTHNRELAAARDEIDASRARVLSAGAYPNPEIELLGGHAFARQPGVRSGESRSASLTQPIDYPWQRQTRREAAEQALAASNAGSQALAIDVLIALRQRVYELMRRSEEAAAAAEDLELTESIRARVARRVELGEAPRFELIKADAERLNAQKAEQAARLRAVQAKVAIRALVGDALPEDFEVDAQWPDIDEALPSLATLRNALLAANPQLARDQAELQRADRQLRLERQRRLPELALKVTSDQDHELRDTRAGVVMTLPLWDRRRGTIAEASAGLSRSRNVLDHDQTTLLNALDAAVQQCELTRTQISALENGILREAEAALRVAESAYRFGERGILDLLDAQRVLRSARNDWIAARYDYGVARAEVDRLLGQP